MTYFILTDSFIKFNKYCLENNILLKEAVWCNECPKLLGWNLTEAKFIKLDDWFKLPYEVVESFELLKQKAKLIKKFKIPKSIRGRIR